MAEIHLDNLPADITEIVTHGYSKTAPVIVIPMAGLSSRFFNAGYTVPKYRLPLGNETLFEKSLKSFENYFTESEFVFIIRQDDEGAFNFVRDRARSLGLFKFWVIALEEHTKGQSETVFKGLCKLKLTNDPRPLIIFNIDTIRKNFELPTEFEWDTLFDAFYDENADESKWSFCKEHHGKIVKTAEKKKISNWCSTGLYIFNSVRNFIATYITVINHCDESEHNYYIAPLYNYIIPKSCFTKNKNYLLKCPREDVEFSGVPEEYEALKIKYLNEEKIT